MLNQTLERNQAAKKDTKDPVTLELCYTTLK